MHWCRTWAMLNQVAPARARCTPYYRTVLCCTLPPFSITELGQKPDLIIGNYSDGNLVASLLAHRMFVTQCNIAHALEKTKYQDADIKW